MNVDLIARILPAYNWLLLPIFLLSFGLVFFRRNNKGLLFLAKSTISYYHYKQLDKQINQPQQPHATIQLISALLLIVINAFLILNQTNGTPKFFEVFVAIVFCFMYVNLLTFISIFLFEIKQVFYDYLSYYKHFLYCLATITIPFSLWFVFYPENGDIFVFGFNTQTVLLIVFSTLFIGRVFQLFFQALYLKFSLFHIILYLCTLEILPFFMFYAYLK